MARWGSVLEQVVDERRAQQGLGIAVPVAGELAPQRDRVVDRRAERTHGAVQLFGVVGMRQVPHYRPEEGDVHALGCLGERPAPQLLCGQRVQLGEPAVLVCARLLSAHTGQPNRSRAAARSRHQAEGAQRPKRLPATGRPKGARAAATQAAAEATAAARSRPRELSAPTVLGAPAVVAAAGRQRAGPPPAPLPGRPAGLARRGARRAARSPALVGVVVDRRPRPAERLDQARDYQPSGEGTRRQGQRSDVAVGRCGVLRDQDGQHDGEERTEHATAAAERARTTEQRHAESQGGQPHTVDVRVRRPVVQRDQDAAEAATGRNRPTARRTGLAMPRKPPSSASAANAANQYIASLVGLYASSSRTVSACIWSHTITPSAAARLAAHPGTWKPITSTTIATPTAMASSAVTVAATTVPPRSM